jgi:deoxyribonuclease V
VKALQLHSWRVTPKQAVQIQLRLRDRVELIDRLPTISKVAGADIALDLKQKRAIAAAIVYSFPGLAELEIAWATRPLSFPYVPGLLSFREIPALLAAFAKLRNTPDLIFVDGHGRAHPRRFGIASHLGVILDCPTIGCAKSLLVGDADEPEDKVGATTQLTHKGEVIGAVLRTKVDVRPIYVSTGHRVSLDTAVKLALDVSDGLRVPKPTREADRYVGKVKEMRRKKS